jgi:S-adenosylhomocysteine hydrolase
MDYSYPILQRVFDHYNNIPHFVGDLYIVGCQHLMEPQKKMLERLIKFGFDKNKIFMLGKAYSSSRQMVEELKEDGIRAIQPDFSGIGFDQEHIDNCKMICKMVPEGARVLLIDDGADLIKVFNGGKINVVFAVEQTSSGFRRLENVKLRFPVFNVARSVTKLTQESPLVARHLFERILNYLNNKGLSKPTILVVGLGPIGEAITEVFKEGGLPVYGFDIKYGHSGLLEKIKEIKPQAIIGATGNNIITKDELEALVPEEKIYLISASSSDREFPVVSFRSGEGTHGDVVYKNFIFVNNGFPFSFMGNRYELTPVEMEKTICLLGGAIMYGVTKGVSGEGLIDIPKELEDIINQ